MREPYNFYSLIMWHVYILFENQVYHLLTMYYKIQLHRVSIFLGNCKIKSLQIKLAYNKAFESKMSCILSYLILFFGKSKFSIEITKKKEKKEFSVLTTALIAFLNQKKYQ